MNAGKTAVNLMIGLSVALLLSAGVHDVFAQSECEATELAKLKASDGAADDSFGLPVVVENDIAVFGAGVDDDKGVDSGSAYVFRYDGSTRNEEQKLLASDGAANRRYAAGRPGGEPR